MFKIVFDLFDTNQSGSVNSADIFAITASMRKDAKLVFDTMQTIKSMSQNTSDQISFGEFTAIMW